MLPHDLSYLDRIDPDFLSHGISSVDTSQGLLSGRPHGGLGILWRRALGESIAILNFDDHRILGLTIKGKLFELLLVNVYLPTCGSANAEVYQEYMGKLDALVRDTENVVIAGDWNARQGREEFIWVTDLCIDLDLVIADVVSLPCDTFT